MMDPSSRPPRKVAIADHIWQAFEEMSSQMGSDRDALINQAMFMFARLNGFLETALAAPGGAPAGGSPREGGLPSSVPAPGQVRPPAPPMLRPAGVGGKGPGGPPLQAEPPSGAMDDDPVRREVQERVLETAAELQRLIKAKNQGPGASMGNAPASEEDAPRVEAEDSRGGAGGAPALYMMLEGGELDRIGKDRFIIGRGKHCDFVINSGKVSREHAVIIRENGQFFLEDLGSSNGTWFNKQRIKRRKIEDGDEYFICSEKVKFVYR
jgi:hypothetical protein